MVDEKHPFLETSIVLNKSGVTIIIIAALLFAAYHTFQEVKAVTTMAGLVSAERRVRSDAFTTLQQLQTATPDRNEYLDKFAELIRGRIAGFKAALAQTDLSSTPADFQAAETRFLNDWSELAGMLAAHPHFNSDDENAAEMLRKMFAGDPGGALGVPGAESNKLDAYFRPVMEKLKTTLSDEQIPSAIESREARRFAWVPGIKDLDCESTKFCDPETMPSSGGNAGSTQTSTVAPALPVTESTPESTPQSQSDGNATPDVHDLISAEEVFNEKCRGGSGGDPATMNACKQRDVLFEKINRLGWCYGTEDQIEADKKWQPCAESSKE